MANYALYETDIIVNVIVADSKELAEEETGLNAIETEGEPWINWTLVNGQWIEPQPFPSWTLQNNEWVAPVKKPEDGKFYIWNEDLGNWTVLGE